jgi:flagellar L-ring protein precursor FlgH
MKTRTAAAIVMSAMVFGSALGQAPASSLFSDHRARVVGDIITILVVEYAAASSEARTSTQKDDGHGFSATGGSGTQLYTPIYGIQGDINNSFSGDASVSRQGRLQTKITATITEVKPNGQLALKGTRTVEVNGEKELTTITGLIRSQDVSMYNTVYSYQLADAQISYKGKGVVNSGQKPGFIAKIFNWIF